jgi:hypothetical protein
MPSTTTRLRFSEEKLEEFISELWIFLERNHLPSPRLRLFTSAPGTTTVELRFGANRISEQFLRNWMQREHRANDAVSFITASSLAAPFI